MSLLRSWNGWGCWFYRYSAPAGAEQAKRSLIAPIDVPMYLKLMITAFNQIAAGNAEWPSSSAIMSNIINPACLGSGG